MKGCLNPLMWTPEEDRRLRRLRDQGLTWEEVAEQLPRRSASGCSKRASVLGINARPKPAPKPKPVPRAPRLYRWVTRPEAPKPDAPRGFHPNALAWATENPTNPEARLILGILGALPCFPKDHAAKGMARPSAGLSE